MGAGWGLVFRALGRVLHGQDEAAASAVVCLLLVCGVCVGGDGWGRGGVFKVLGIYVDKLEQLQVRGRVAVT